MGTNAPATKRLSLLLIVVAANQRLGQLVERELAADGVGSNDYALLSLIGARGPVRLTEVAAELACPDDCVGCGSPTRRTRTRSTATKSR